MIHRNKEKKDAFDSAKNPQAPMPQALISKREW